VITVYLCGWLITTVGTLAAADWVSGGDKPPARVWVGIVAGVLWPVVILGLVQLAAIAVTARASRTAAVRRHSGRRATSIRLKEVIAVSSY
jgi:dolichol kinase